MNGNSLPLQVECTYFFEENPYAMETAQSLALRIGRSADQLAPILEHLAALTILSKFGEGANAIYRYSQPIMVKEKLGDLWKED